MWVRVGSDRIHPAFLAYANHMLLNYQQENPGKFQSNDQAFHRALASSYTPEVCGPSLGIVKPQEHGSKKNKMGDL
jgi:hypothetical protein